MGEGYNPGPNPNPNPNPNPGQVAPALALGQELPDLEGATRCIWKDETSELAQLKASLKQVQTQVKLDKIAEFTDSMGLFQADASKKVEALAAVHAETQAAIPPTRTPTRTSTPTPTLTLTPTLT